MNVWIIRIELCLWVMALIRLQVIAIHRGQGLRHLGYCLLAFFGGITFLSWLGGDYLGQIGHVLFIAGCLGMLLARSPQLLAPQRDC